MFARGRWPLQVIRAFALVAALGGLVIITLGRSEWDDFALVFLLVMQVLNLLLCVGTLLSRGWHPTVEPTGRVLQPVAATATWPRSYPLLAVHRLRGRYWVRRRWWVPRLVLWPGRLSVIRRSDLPGPAVYRVQTDPAGSTPLLVPDQVRLVQPLLSRPGKPGLVVHLHGGSPIFLFGPEPREAVLTEVAAAGFAVDGAEQQECRRWARTPRPRPVPIRPFPAPPGPWG